MNKEDYMEFVDPKDCPWFQELGEIAKKPGAGSVERARELMQLIQNRSKARVDAQNAALAASIKALYNRG